LAASHYRMIEAGSAILQSSRAVRVVETFETVEFVPLCQVLVAIQILDAARGSSAQMRVANDLLKEVGPGLGKVLELFDALWEQIEAASTSEVARLLQGQGVVRKLEEFLTAETAGLAAGDIDNFMTPTYQLPITGPLYHKIGNILQGLAPFYLDTVLELIDNLRNITPRVTAQELARWEASHKSRIAYIIGIVRRPEMILDVETFDYSFLWQESFRKLFVMHRDETAAGESVYDGIVRCLRHKYESERAKYERALEVFDTTVAEKLAVRSGRDVKKEVDRLLLHRDVPMNNLWFYFMSNGYVVPFIDDAEPGASSRRLYGSSLDYDETCDKLMRLRKICGDIGFAL